MNKTEMKAFLREARSEIRVDRTSDHTTCISDKSGTMMLVSHDPQITDKLVALGAQLVGDDLQNKVLGNTLRNILDDRTYLICRPIRVTVERDGERRTLLLPEDDGGHYSLPVCVSASKLGITNSEKIYAAGPGKPIQVWGSDYWLMIFPIRVNRDNEWCKELNHIAWRL